MSDLDNFTIPQNIDNKKQVNRECIFVKPSWCGD
jgi:hypothetical protein